MRNTLRAVKSALRLVKNRSEVPPLLWSGLVLTCPGPTGHALRYRYWKRRLRHLGDNVVIDVGVHFQRPEWVEVEDNCWLDRNVLILAGPDPSARERFKRTVRNFPGEPGVVHIGRNIHIAPNCIISGISAGVYLDDDCALAADTKIYAFSHHYRSRKRPGDTNVHFGPMVAHDRQCMVEGAVYLARNTGVAVNCVLLPGTSIGRNSFVSIGSVVHGGAFPENSMIAGNPATTIGARFVEKP